MSRREALHEMIDFLPDDAIEEVERLVAQLQFARLERMLAEAPVDDEPLDAEDYARLEAGGDRGLTDHADVVRLVAEWTRAAG